MVFSKDQAEHWKYLEILLQLPRQPDLHFLGHIVGAQGLRVDPQKVAIVQDWLVPNQNLAAEVLGSCQLLQETHHGLGKPHLCIEKADTFDWDADCDAALAGI